MAQTMSQLEKVPQWIIQLIDEIDSVRFGEAFQRFAPDSELLFGSHRSSGQGEIQEYFRQMHIPIKTKHQISEVWAGGHRTYVLGEVKMIKKTEPHDLSAEPFQWMFYEDESGGGLLRRWLVTAGPA